MSSIRHSNKFCLFVFVPFCIYIKSKTHTYSLNTHAFECERNLTYVKIVKFCGKLNKFPFPIPSTKGSPFFRILTWHKHIHISLSYMVYFFTHTNQGRYLFYYYIFYYIILQYIHKKYWHTCLHIIFRRFLNRCYHSDSWYALI